MNETSIKARGKTRTTLHRAYAFALSVIMLLAVTAGAANAAAPLAGSSIGNQASATYNDGVGGPQKQATSNIVTTVVQQVPGLTLTIDNQSKSVSVGGAVYFLHTVTNTGNGNDTFTLTSSWASGNSSFFNSTGIYADLGTGSPGAALSPSQTTTLAPGGTFTFYVQGFTSTGLAATDTATITAKATSTFGSKPSASNTDNVTVNPYANLTVNKTINSVTGPTTITGVNGGNPVYVINYKVAYANGGNATATNFTITDLLPAGGGNTTFYVPNSGVWSVGSLALNDTYSASNQGTSPNTINYNFGHTANTITAVISQVPINNSGYITYSIAYPATAGPTTVFNAAAGVIHNDAAYSYSDGGGNTKTGDAMVDYTIPTVRTVVLDDNGSTNDQDGSANKIVTRNTAPQNGVVWFDNVIHNTGNVSDQYTMSYTDDATNPFGGTVTYYADNGSGAPGNKLTSNITDPVAAAGTYHVWVQVALPSGAKGTGVGGNGYKLLLKATSTANPAVSDTDTDKLLAIQAGAVDITNNVALGGTYNSQVCSTGNPNQNCGAGVTTTGEASPVTTVAVASTNPATPAYFTLYLNNTAGTPESYSLAYSNTGNFSSPTQLPAGWSVAFAAGDGNACSSTHPGTALSNNITAVVNGGANLQICAVVTPPANAAGTGSTPIDVFFQATGVVSGASDVKHDAVTVSAAYSFTLLPPNTGQVVPSGSKQYTHQLCNTSNVAVGKTLGDLTIATTGDTGGFTSILYVDAAMTTVLTDVSQLNGGTGLTANGTGATSCATIYVKVTAPSGPLGAVDLTTIQVTSTKSKPTAKVVVSTTDQTTIQVAQLTIDKYQVIGACNADPKTLTGYTKNQLTTGANPGACIYYMLVVSNGGNQVADQIAVTDSLPNAFTVYSKGLTCYPGGVFTQNPGGTGGAAIYSGALAGSDPNTSQPYGGSGLGSAISITPSQPAECTQAGSVSFSGFSLPGASLATMFFSVQIMQ